MPYSIFIVEDDPRVRRDLVHGVRAASDLILAGEAADLPEARRLLKACSPDVLLVDLDLPSGSGIELIHWTASTLPSCEIMVITWFGDERHVVACLEAGATGYLLKGTGDIDIAEHVRVLCAGGSPISPTIARRLLKRFTSANSPAPIEADAATLPDLSAQERSVLSLCAKGYTYQEIATLLALSSHTVKTYVKRIYRKLQVHSKTEAVYEARKLNWLDD